jgi:hypothetical protein
MKCDLPRTKLKERQRAAEREAPATSCEEDGMTVTWHGRAAEYRDLVDAVARNCSCEYGIGLRTRCAAHQMIAEEQRVLDGLLFARRMSDRLRREEWSNAGAATGVH